MGMPLIKIATSFDARRSKQYWQLLKRMHGGNDEAIAAIKATGDHHIYHGTAKKNIPSILENGLRNEANTANGNNYGPGVYLGNRERGEHYAGKGGLLRLALPSELKGTKELYPNPSNTMKFNDADAGGKALASNLALGSFMAKWFPKLDTVEQFQFADPSTEVGKHYLDAVQKVQGACGTLGSADLKVQNRMKFYGKLPEGIEGDKIIPGQMLLKDEDVSPGLIHKV
jgi:hypothetical protein